MGYREVRGIPLMDACRMRRASTDSQLLNRVLSGAIRFHAKIFMVTSPSPTSKRPTLAMATKQSASTDAIHIQSISPLSKSIDAECFVSVGGKVMKVRDVLSAKTRSLRRFTDGGTITALREMQR